MDEDDWRDSWSRFATDAAQGLFILALFVLCMVIGGWARLWLWGGW